MAQTPAGKVFISYSHKDKAYLDRLQEHLRPHVRSGALPVWVDTQLKAGDEWKKEIEAALEAAQVAILLVSVSFLASDFVAEEELPKLLTAAEQRGVLIVPVILTPCAFKRSSLYKYQAINDPARPLSLLPEGEHDVIWDLLVERVLDALDKQHQQQTPPPNPPKQAERARSEPAPQPTKSKVALVEEGEQHRAAGRYVEALDCYEQALELDARYLLALRGKSLALLGLNHPMDALAAANEAIRVAPEDAAAHYNKGLILKRMGRYGEALPAFEEALKLHPQFSWAYILKSQALAELNKYTEAVATLEQALTLNPNDKTVRQALERLYRRVPVGTPLLALSGHTHSVHMVAWSSDGTHLASASTDHTARIWDAVNGQLLATLSGHTLYVQALAWSPDGRRLASASADQTVRLWDAASGQALATLSGHTKWVEAVAWSPDARFLASASQDETVRLWDGTSGQALITLSGRYPVAWSPDGRHLASASSDYYVGVWWVGEGQA
jgi:tetratricopeptide (TPR) repeat protein